MERLASNAPRLLRTVPAHYRVAAIELAHWGYGTLAGAAYALLPDRLRRVRGVGPLYGLAIWTAYELGVRPLLEPNGHDADAGEKVALAADHALYGAVVGAR